MAQTSGVFPAADGEQGRACRTCATAKPLSAFYRRGAGYSGSCADCVRARATARYKAVKSGTWRNWRTPLRPTEHPTMIDIGWAAGFLEGEGSFRGSKQERSARVQGVQKDPETLFRLQRLFGGSIHKNRQAIHVWHLCGARAAGLMMTLYPLLSERRKVVIRDVLSRCMGHRMRRAA